MMRENGNGIVRWIGALFAIVAVAAATSGAAEVNTDKLVTYYRKKANLGPNANVAVVNLKDSAIQGAKQGTLRVGTPPQVREQPFMISADGRYVIFGEVEDLTVDPFKKVMEKISLRGEPAKGPKGAKVTIVEYSDFQCPFCGRAYNTIEKEVLRDYGDKVRFYYKHYPLNFHPWAQPAAIAAECAGRQSEEAYWKLYETFFEKQREINPQNLKEKVDEALKDAKIDKQKFDACFNNQETLEQVRAEMAEGQSVGVNGTPGFIINGRLISGAQPYQVFKNVIDDELASK